MLKVIAHIHAKPGHEAEVQRGCESLVEPTRAEDGCIQYELYADPEDPCHFIFDEAWESYDQWQAHLQSDHIAANNERTGTLRQSVTVYQGHKIL